MSVYEQTKKAVLNELKKDYGLYGRVSEIYQVAEEAKQEAKRAMEQDKQNQVQKKKPSIAEFARNNRKVK